MRPHFGETTKRTAPPPTAAGEASASSARNDRDLLDRPPRKHLNTGFGDLNSLFHHHTLAPRKHLNTGFGDVNHLFDANALSLAIALLGFNCEAHVFLNHHRVIE